MHLKNKYFLLMILAACLSCLGILHAKECGKPYVVVEGGVEIRDGWDHGVEGQKDRNIIVRHWERAYVVKPPPCSPGPTYKDLQQAPDVSLYSDTPPQPEAPSARPYLPSTAPYPDRSHEGSMWDGVPGRLSPDESRRIYSSMMEDIDRINQWHMTANISKDCTTEESRENRAKTKQNYDEIAKLAQKTKQINEENARLESLNRQKLELLERFSHYREKRLAAEKKIQEMDFPDRRQNIVDISREVAQDSLELARQDETEDALFGIGLAETVLDLATSLTPGVSWVRDVYESISGRHLITGEDLSTSERLMASAGALSAGLGSKVGKFAKIVDRLGMGADSAGIIHKAEKVYDSAKSFGVKTGEQVKKFAEYLNKPFLPGSETGSIKINLEFLKKNSGKATSPVGNMTEFFQNVFGKQMKSQSAKTTTRVQGQAVYKANSKVGETIKKGDHYYLDGLHKDHLEVFDSNGKFKHVLNLDGTINVDKTTKAAGRSINL
ncbi:MAG: pre-toxin TG domain-containing protein [Deltaproteobacteria bacterium]|nr:pre-toxin TG domain-containing protein [Deltaproteobacteria bacterium]